MNLKTNIFIFLFMLSSLYFANAQSKTSDLQIDKVFATYGKAKGSLMVELESESDEAYYYRSLETNNNSQAIDFAKKCIEKDKINAKKIKEVYADGKPTTIYLTLETRDDFHRFILFNDNGRRKMTLVYIESENKDILKIILEKQ